MKSPGSESACQRAELRNQVSDRSLYLMHLLTCGCLGHTNEVLKNDTAIGPTRSSEERMGGVRVCTCKPAVAVLASRHAAIRMQKRKCICGMTVCENEVPRMPQERRVKRRRHDGHEGLECQKSTVCKRRRHDGHEGLECQKSTVCKRRRHDGHEGPECHKSDV
jgi:hypothetical protein